MNRIVKYLFFIAGISMAASLTSCVKNRNDLNTDFSGLKPLLEIRTPIVNRAGLLNFTSASLNFDADPDTVSFYVNLASVDALNEDLSVTVGIDDAAMQAYNSDPNTEVDYTVFPDSTYDLLQSDVTIPAGQHVAKVDVVFYASKIDPSQSYMLPLSVTEAEGLNISANFGTIYYHVIGNPLAGAYTQDFYRWNGTVDTTTAPNSTVFEDEPIVISAINPNSILLPESYIQTFVGTSAGVTLSFDNNAGVLSNFQVSLSSSTLAGLAAGGFTVVTSPILVDYELVGDASTNYAGSRFRIYTVLMNSTPAIRTLIDEFVKQ